MHFDQLKRREVISLLGGAAAAWPLAARAQHSAKPVVGFMHATAEPNSDFVVAFKEGLSQTGYVDGRNVTIEFRSAEGQYDRLPAIAAEFVRRQVNVIAAGTPVAALAAKRATTSIPIVFSVGSDPTKDGLVASLSRPGGNITGATFFSNLLTAKRLGLMHELAPNARVFSALVNPKNANAQLQMDEAEQAVRTLGAQIAFVNASTENEIEKAFANFRQQRADALLILSDSFLNSHAHRIAELALLHALPTCFSYRELAVAGGLMSYGASRNDSSRQSGVYAGRILNGEKPGDLPVQQPTKFEFVINIQTARALGIDVPPGVLALADEVIE
jgi:putative tryptophan/tyrosine transport system substrate-binding protein